MASPDFDRKLRQTRNDVADAYELLKAVEIQTAETNTKVDALSTQVDARFGQHDVRFDQIDARFDQHDARFDQLDNQMAEVLEILREAA